MVTEDDWDESVMTTASGPTVAATIDDLIQIARDYRKRTDERNAEIRAEYEEDAAKLQAAKDGAE